MGMLLPSDMLWLEGSPKWVPAGSKDGVFALEPAATPLPDFLYAYLPLFRPDLRHIVFTIDRTGTLTRISKHKTKADLWILDAEGRETSVRIIADIPLKEGHRVTVINACLDGCHVRRCMILDHTAAVMHFRKRSLLLLTPSLMETMCLLTPFLAFFLYIFLVSRFPRLVNDASVNWPLFILTIASIPLYVHLFSLRQHFTRHCEAIADQLLKSK